MAVNLLVDLARFGPETVPSALRDAEARGYRIARAARDDERLWAWIDLVFAPSWWSSEARASDVWVATTADGEPAGFAATGFPRRDYPWLRGWRDRPDVVPFGPYGVAPAHRKTGLGAALLAVALADLATRVPRALIAAVAGERLVASYVARTGAQVVDTYAYPAPRGRAVLLASGNGTNVQAVLDANAAGRLALDLRVVTNVADAFVRERARRAGIAEDAVVWRRGEESRAAYDGRVIDAVAASDPDLVLLLGWMHLLPAAFVARFPATLNVHPAFLPFDPGADDVTMPDGSHIPAFRGARALEATVAAGVPWSGVSVHSITAEADRGTIFVRTPLALADGTSVDGLRSRIHPLEHAAVERAIRRWSFERP